MSGMSDDALLYLLKAVREGRVSIETKGDYTVKSLHAGPGSLEHFDNRTYHIVVEPTYLEKRDAAELKRAIQLNDPEFRRSVRNLAEMSDDEYYHMYQEDKSKHPDYDPKLHADYYRNRNQMKINVSVDEDGGLSYNG